MDRVEGALTLARLRDACPCPRCIHPSTRQKTHTSGEAAREVASLTDVAARVGQQEGVAGLFMQWGEHEGFYPIGLIRRLLSGRVRGTSYIENTLQRKLWDRDTLVRDAKSFYTEYNDLHAGKPGEKLEARPEALLRLLEQLQVYGLAVVRGLPTNKTGNKDCALRELAESVGLLRNTFYGETWDVRNVPNSKNVAYTNLNLGLHVDLLYFALPPRFQLLHALRNRVVGGESYFVDSFAAAQQLKAERPDLYASLQRNIIEYEYDNDGHYLSYQHAVLPPRDLTAPGLHSAINWSPPFQAPAVQRPVDASGAVTMQAEAEFYEACDAFQAALDDPKFRHEFLLREGECVLFDNQRVLHARTAFRDKTEEEIMRDGTILVPGESTRWLKGCYLDGSTVWDKLAVLNEQVRGKQSI
ncbi:Clavaminate synthase-like protein [Cutaneotrichosporon oleaginosum]|uniref:Clavaminate synthase-like protein n=2 Tax=Cutaneotrichosporon oleaginosum TaxID=879819 RepID=A0A0J0XRW5_9TREE|nr:Clavaminate synthase-like protein [Cutaneotrichosporon oleaginosum]KLT43832.1 Clavaminate synthase-like protein [Cutaneotrichosporon oleaginosum]